MQQPLMFVKVKDRDAHAILNLQNVVYMEGEDATSRTIIYSTGGKITIDVPWEQMLDDVRRLLKDNYEFGTAHSVALQDRMIEKLMHGHEHSH